jgi:transposase
MSQSKPQGRSYWVEHIETWRASGVSRTEYCKINGLSRKALGWWIWRLDQEQREPPAPEAPRFLPVELSEAVLAGPEAADPVDQRIEITLPGGVAVRVGRGFDAEALHRVLTVLGR